MSHGWESNEKELRAIYEKKERLGLIYADDPKALINIGVFHMGEYGSSMEIVDGDAQSNLESPKETVWQNIRSIFKWLGIKVFIFRDRVEIRGFIPTEVIDIPGIGEGVNRAAIIRFQFLREGGQGDRFTKSV